MSRSRALVVVCLTRLSYVDVASYRSGVDALIQAIVRDLPEAMIVIKPHPRDKFDEVSDAFANLASHSSVTLLAENLWHIPLEILAHMLNPQAILAGWSTIGINSDLVPNSQVIVTDLLSFEREGVSNLMKKMIERIGTYGGATARDVVRAMRTVRSSA